MELLQLKYFLELAKHQHLTRVAEMMYVSPSAISSSISRLEKELGVELFDHVGRNICLNEAGQEYLPYVENALNQLVDGEKRIKDIKSASGCNLTIAMTHPYIWKAALHEFYCLYPDINFTHFLFDPVISGKKSPEKKLDLLIISPESFSDPSMDYEILFEDRIALAVPPTHRFANRKSISLYEAREELFVNLPDSLFQQYCDLLCQEAGFKQKSKITCDYMLRSEIALKEEMVALTTFNCRNAGLFKDLVLIPLSDPKAKRHQAIFWPKDRYLSSPAKMLIDYLKALYSDFKIE